MNRRALLTGCTMLLLLPKPASGAGERFTLDHLLRLIDTPGARFVGKQFLAEHPEFADQARLRGVMLHGSRIDRLDSCTSEKKLAVLYQSWCRADFQQNYTLKLSGTWCPITELAACATLVLAQRSGNH